MPVRYDLFLAHASADKDAAVRLYELLHPGVRVFLDCRSILPGDQWDREIPRAQRDSLATVILVSRHADAAYYLRDEIHTAIAIHRARPDEHRAIPVFLEGVPHDPEALPYGLRILQGIDAGSEGLDGVAARLREVALRLRGLPAPTPPAPSAAAAAPTTHTAPPAAPCNPRALYQRLLRLATEPQFEEILFLAEVPPEHVRTRATRSERALDAALLAGADPELCARLVHTLDERAPFTR